MLKKLGMALGCAALVGCTQSVETGRMSFADNCAICHGTDGKGGGDIAHDLVVMPPDLTTISARNGGVFPRNEVASIIDGYTRGEHFGGAMPEFGPLLAGDNVLMETGEGVVTPTPERLVALVDYLESIQEI